MSKIVRVRGAVKWYDHKKGYGFVTSYGNEGDIMFHAKVLREFGMRSLLPGFIMECDAENVNGRWRATAMHSVEPAGPIKIWLGQPEYMTEHVGAGQFRAVSLENYARAERAIELCIRNGLLENGEV